MQSCKTTETVVSPPVPTPSFYSFELKNFAEIITVDLPEYEDYLNIREDWTDQQKEELKALYVTDLEGHKQALLYIMKLHKELTEAQVWYDAWIK